MAMDSGIRKLKSVSFMVAVLAMVPVTLSQAQLFPSKPIRIVTTGAAGGSASSMARILAQRLAEITGQQAIVDDRPGAGGSVGVVYAVKAPPDGYTILMQTIPLVVNPALYPKLPYDTIKDLAPVSLIVASPFILI